MGLEIGTRLGKFAILAPLGEGGMGEVYRARDEQLDREVAIKVLPDRLTANEDALTRFEREAKAVASLSHPNILQLHEFGRDGGTVYAVTELLEGETLRERIDGGGVPPRKAAELGRQIAHGLGAAHEKGVVHRDIKPENLFLTRDGRVKILDFGLARVDETPASPGATHSLTRTELTTPGAVLGTVSYMSPEQVRGQPATPLSDIFSLGVVLYETFTGERAFARETAAETMTAILREEPPETPFAARQVPPALQRIVQRCIEKRPEERFRSAHDLAFALDGLSRFSTTGEEALPALRDRAPVGRRLRAVLGSVLLLALGAVAGFAIATRWNPRSEPQPVLLRSISLSGQDQAPAASPDGRFIAFVSRRGGTPRIWLKQLSDGSEVALTAGPDNLPRFSADGSSIFFVRDEGETSAAYRVAIVGGRPRRLIPDANAIDASPDGERLAFLGPGTNPGSMILGLTNTDGGTARPLWQAEERRLLGVRWSPDGSRIALLECIPVQTVGCSIAIVDVASGAVRRLFDPLPVISQATWSGTGDELVYAWGEEGLTGGSTPVRVVRHHVESGQRRTLFWAENLNGTIDILAPGTMLLDSAEIRQNLAEYEPGQTGRGSPVTRGASQDRQPVYSPDGTTVLFSSNRAGNLDLWTVSPASGEVQRLTDDAASDWDPAFTPDGKQLLWSSDRGGNLEIWIANADGSGARQLTNDGVDAENPTATADGEWIVYASGNPDKLGIWKIRPDGSDATLLAGGTHFIPELSPDGRYVLYANGDSDRSEVTIRVREVDSGAEVPFQIRVRASPSTSAMLSVGRARWMPDGRAIVVLGEDREGRVGLYRQAFDPGRDTSESLRPVQGFDPDSITESFGVAPDGTRLMVSGLESNYGLLLAEGVAGVEPPRGR